MILGNAKPLAKVRAIVRYSSRYQREPIEGLVGTHGNPITRKTYGGIYFAYPCNKAGTNTPIIQITAGKASLYTYRANFDGFHSFLTSRERLAKTWLPDFSNVKAVQEGGIEFGPVGVALKAAAVLRCCATLPSIHPRVGHTSTVRPTHARPSQSGNIESHLAYVS
ncbi:hypothetical protein [Leucobacter salsicius]|uniref:hypothetical protein n=1 Tax=Leucobacter salsicius TaxID=664638 RepID=UPI000688C42A|nr:hypothetical protein [Leucobacter salsicius]